MTQRTHSSAHTSLSIRVPIGWFLLLLLLVAAGALHKPRLLSLRSTAGRSWRSAGVAPWLKPYRIFGNNKNPQHCTVQEHVLCAFSPSRQINAQHRHPRNKTREKQGPFCAQKQKRIGRTAARKRARILSMHTLCARTTMKPEISAAVGFLSRFLRIKGHVNDRQLQTFSQTLQDILAGKLHYQRYCFNSIENLFYTCFLFVKDVGKHWSLCFWVMYVLGHIGGSARTRCAQT